MSSYQTFYVETTTDGTTWSPMMLATPAGQANCSGWWTLLGLTPATTGTGEPFPGIATRGYPTDLHETTIAAMIDCMHMDRHDDGTFSRDENTSFAWFTLADLDALLAIGADFTDDRRGYTVATTLDTAPFLDTIREHAVMGGIRREHVRLIVATD